MRIQPSTMCFALSDAAPAQHREEVEAQLAMMAPLMMLRRQPPMSRANGGMVWYESKLQGKITVGTEWGGGGMCHPSDYDSLYQGVLNSLRSLRVLQDGHAVGENRLLVGTMHARVDTCLRCQHDRTRACAADSDTRKPRPAANCHRTAP